MPVPGISKHLTEQIDFAFGTTAKFVPNRVKHGFELRRPGEHIATVYWGLLAPDNQLEIALAPDRLSQFHKAEIVKDWLSLMRDDLKSVFNDHFPASSWVTIGLKAHQVEAFLDAVRLFRLTPTLQPGYAARLAERKASVAAIPSTSSTPALALAPVDAIPVSLPIKANSFGTGRMFVSNFGVGNYLWPECRRESRIVTFELEVLLPYVRADDSETFSRIATELGIKSEQGITASAGTLTGWFNVARVFQTSVNDLWLHSDGDALWWTTTLSEAPIFRSSTRELPNSPGMKVCEIAKAAAPWRCQDLKGRRLSWRSLHPKAQNFLFTRRTMHTPGEGNRAYIEALLRGDDLEDWHRLPEWVAAATASTGKLTNVTSEIENESWTMAMQAQLTTSGANGQQAMTTIKNKDLNFNSTPELAAYIRDLILKQKGLCAISGIPLQYRSSSHDPKLLCSLDRIDSSGHYEHGNLQVVCRFINFWKGASDDSEFRQLLQLVCTTNDVRSMGSVQLKSTDSIAAVKN
jgi:hypothetical protein